MSAVQFNLLPDVKLEFDKSQRQKRLVYGLSALASIVVLVIFLISLLSVDVVQKKLLSDNNKQINNYSQQLKSIPDLEKILTIQNQLGALPGLHQQKNVASRLFSYLPEITPANLSIGKLTMDTSASSIEIIGTADKVETINQFVDTLKFTNYKVQSDTNSTKAAFSNVILTQVDRNNKEAVYTVDANYDPALFDASQYVSLVVPKETTTRSVLNAPAAAPLFNGDTGKTNQQGGQ